MRICDRHNFLVESMGGISRYNKKAHRPRCELAGTYDLKIT